MRTIGALLDCPDTVDVAKAIDLTIVAAALPGTSSAAKTHRTASNPTARSPENLLTLTPPLLSRPIVVAFPSVGDPALGSIDR